MNELQATGIMIALFALRCVLPLALTAGIGYLMNRLYARWEAEGKLGHVEGTPQPQPAPQAPRPGITTPQPQPAFTLPKLDIPCWILRNCDQEKRETCPNFPQGGLRCWLARMSADGTLAACCEECAVYRQALAAAQST